MDRLLMVLITLSFAIIDS